MKFTHDDDELPVYCDGQHILSLHTAVVHLQVLPTCLSAINRSKESP